jgi:hypothetical protein
VTLDELGLAAVAPRRHDHVARDSVGHRRTVVAAHDVQAQVDPGTQAGGRQDPSVVGEQNVLVERCVGKEAAEVVGVLQWVVARWPSRIPAAASTKAPVQIDTHRASAGTEASAARTSSGSVPALRGPGTRVPGTMTVCAVVNACGPADGTIAYPRDVATGPPSMLTTWMS